MKLDQFTRHLTKEQEKELGYATRKALFIYLLTKKRDEEENKALISCILSYLFITVMILLIVYNVFLLSKESIIDESMIKGFAIKAVGILVFTVIMDLFFIGKKWYDYTNKIRNKVRKQIDDELRKY